MTVKVPRKEWRRITEKLRELEERLTRISEGGKGAVPTLEPQPPSQPRVTKPDAGIGPRLHKSEELSSDNDRKN